FWVVQSGQMKVTIEGQEPFIASKHFSIQVPKRLQYSMEVVGNEPALRFEMRPAGESPDYPLSETPTPVKGVEYIKAVYSGHGNYDGKVNVPYIDFEKQIVQSGEKRSVWLRDAAESLIVIPAGFDETQRGGERAARIRDAVADARTRSDDAPVINGGNCVGIRSRPGRYDTMFIPTWKLPVGGRPSPIALITGSGAFAVTRLSRLGRLDPRYVITIGNQMDLTVGDYLTHFADDPSVRVVGVYIEGFRPLDGARFFEAAARITAQGRVVVLYRAGRTSAGAKASASHTAAIAGDATVTRELARQTGVAWADTPAAFDDLVRTFALLGDRRPAGRRLGALSNAGSECVTIADHHGSLVVSEFADATTEALAAVFGPAGIDAVVDIHDPLDITPIADAAVYDAVARIVLEADEVDVAIVGMVPVTETVEALEPGPGHPEDLARPGAIADRMAALWRASTKPWVAVVDAGALYDAFVERLEDAGIPTFRTADAATRALAVVCDVTLRR
ncbi:MAG: hypothetical protein WCH74_06830, partial [Chloroflexota bacterium]